MSHLYQLSKMDYDKMSQPLRLFLFIIDKQNFTRAHHKRQFQYTAALIPLLTHDLSGSFNLSAIQTLKAKHTKFNTHTHTHTGTKTASQMNSLDFNSDSAVQSWWKKITVTAVVIPKNSNDSSSLDEDLQN